MCSPNATDLQFFCCFGFWNYDVSFSILSYFFHYGIMMPVSSFATWCYDVTMNTRGRHIKREKHHGKSIKIHKMAAALTEVCHKLTRLSNEISSVVVIIVD